MAVVAVLLQVGVVAVAGAGVVRLDAGGVGVVFIVIFIVATVLLGGEGWGWCPVFTVDGAVGPVARAADAGDAELGGRGAVGGGSVGRT